MYSELAGSLVGFKREKMRDDVQKGVIDRPIAKFKWLLKSMLKNN